MKKYNFIISILISAGLLLFIYAKFDISNIQEAFKKSNLIILFFSNIIFIVIIIAISSLRWQLTLKLIDCKIKYKYALTTFMASLPVSKLTPANSGDITKALYLKNKVAKSKIIGVIAIERLTDVMLLSIISFFSGIILKKFIICYLSFSFLLTVIVIFIIAHHCKIKPSNRWLVYTDNIISVFKKSLKKPWIFIGLIIYTTILWFTIFLFYKLLFLSLGAKINILNIILIQPISILLALAPITISGIGIREGSMIFLYSKITTATNSFLAGFLYSFTNIVILSLIGLPFLLNIIKLKKNNERNNR